MALGLQFHKKEFPGAKGATSCRGGPCMNMDTRTTVTKEEAYAHTDEKVAEDKAH